MRITIEHNNKPNTARPGSILHEVPSGTGILHLGVDDSRIADNQIEDNDFSGIAMVDYCVVVAVTDFPCSGPNMGPTITPEFLGDQAATGNRIEGNVLVHNGTNADPSYPFAIAAADITYVSAEPAADNCRVDNVFTTLFSLIFPLPPCP